MIPKLCPWRPVARTSRPFANRQLGWRGRPKTAEVDWPHALSQSCGLRSSVPPRMSISKTPLRHASSHSAKPVLLALRKKVYVQHGTGGHMKKPRRRRFGPEKTDPRRRGSLSSARWLQRSVCPLSAFSAPRMFDRARPFLRFGCAEHARHHPNSY